MIKFSVFGFEPQPKFSVLGLYTKICKNIFKKFVSSYFYHLKKKYFKNLKKTKFCVFTIFAIFSHFYKALFYALVFLFILYTTKTIIIYTLNPTQNFKSPTF